MNQKAVVALGVCGVILSLFLAASSFISWQITAVLITVALGIPSLMLAYEKQRSETPKQKHREQKKRSRFIFTKGSIREETIVLSPIDAYYYEFELTKNENLKGEILSNEPVDVYFVDEINFEKWSENKSHDIEDCNEAILDAKINYSVPRAGVWFLIIENNRRKSAKVKVHLF